MRRGISGSPLTARRHSPVETLRSTLQGQPLTFQGKPLLEGIPNEFLRSAIGNKEGG